MRRLASRPFGWQCNVQMHEYSEIAFPAGGRRWIAVHSMSGMIDPTWHTASLNHLRLMLQYAAALQQTRDGKPIFGFHERLELTLPCGMDDGDSVVRLTITEPPYVETGPRAVLAVVVFAEAVRFGQDLPRRTIRATTGRCGGSVPRPT